MPGREELIERMLSADRTDDGAFIIAVRTTGIYCLPSCRPPRRPLPKNVEFYSTPEEARAAGFRPCKLCRPDDFYMGHDPEQEAIGRVGETLANGLASIATVADLAAAAQISQGFLYRVCKMHWGTTPGELLVRSRVLAVKQALRSSEGTVTEIAFDSGFRSISAFNTTFRRATGVTPTEFRRLTTASPGSSSVTA